MAKASSKANEADLEEAFRLIAEGNQKSEAQDFWKAAESYAQAQRILQKLADDAATSAPSTSSLTDSEQAKIAVLYRQQAAEYLQRSRGSLISALRTETDSDRASSAVATTGPEVAANPNSSLLSSLSDEDCTFRMILFGRLFAKDAEDAKTVDEKESDLMARLQQLSDSLPPSFKSEAEKVRDLNRGLARLGLARLPTDEDEENERRRRQRWGLDEAAVPLDESEQVELILAQAKDEVAFNVQIEGGTSTGTTGMSDSALAEAAAKGALVIPPKAQPDIAKGNDDDHDDDSLPIDASEDDANLTPEVCKDLHDKLAEAQIAISELVALFAVDQSNDAAIEFEQPRGRVLLNQVRRRLRDVADKWEAC